MLLTNDYELLTDERFKVTGFQDVFAVLCALFCLLFVICKTLYSVEIHHLSCFGLELFVSA